MTFLCYFLLVIEAAFICAVLLSFSAYLVMGKSFRLLCSFCGHSFGLFRGVTSPLFKFQKLKAQEHIMLFDLLLIFSHDGHKLGVIPFVLGCNWHHVQSNLGLVYFNHCLVHCCLIRCHLQDVDHCKSTLFLQHAIICSAGFLVLCFAITSQVITGKSFRGRQTADDVLKSAILSVIGVVS